MLGEYGPRGLIKITIVVLVISWRRQENRGSSGTGRYVTKINAGKSLFALMSFLFDMTNFKSYSAFRSDHYLESYEKMPGENLDHLAIFFFFYYDRNKLCVPSQCHISFRIIMKVVLP